MTLEVEPTSADVPFVPIECDYLDGENVGWAKIYIEQCRTRLEALEQEPDESYAAYLRTEIAAWHELLVRFNKA